MGIFEILGIVVGTLSTLALVAGGYYVVRGTAVKQASEAWRSEAEAQKSRADRFENDLLVVKRSSGEQIELLKRRLDTLEQDNKTLRELVTGRAQLEGLSELLRAQHAETMATLLALPKIGGI